MWTEIFRPDVLPCEHTLIPHHKTAPKMHKLRPFGGPVLVFIPPKLGLLASMKTRSQSVIDCGVQSTLKSGIWGINVTELIVQVAK